MNDPEFRLLEQIEEDHWWFVGKRLLLRAIFDRLPPGDRFLDMGCGTGGILRDYMAESTCVGADRSALALRICRDQGFSTLARADLDKLPFRPATFDTIVLLDVLEHLDDDIGFLREAAKLCRPGGQMVISVPAFQLLWSQHDETFEHRRRYRASQLEKVVRASGLEPVWATYTNFIVFPLAAVWRVLSYRLGFGRFAPAHDFWGVPSWVNRTLIRLYEIEAWLARRMRLPVGVSAVCVAKRAAPR